MPTSSSNGVPRAPEPALELDYVEMYVGDLDAATADWTGRYAFTRVAASGSAQQGFRSVQLRQGDISLVLTEGTAPGHPAAGYVEAHGDGVADIALRCADVRTAFAAAVRRGARPVAEPARHPGGAVTAAVGTFGDVVHTLVERAPGGEPGRPVGFRALPAADARPGAADDPALLDVDHFAVCVGVGELDRTIAFYEQALGFHEAFEEHIVVGEQAMLSKVVRSAVGGVTFTVIAPDPTAEPGQIDEFLAGHAGAGIQHIALRTDDAVRAVRALGRRGVDFLTTPGAYYDALADRIAPRGHTGAELRELGLLVDEDHAGQLFQIFTRSEHPRRTLFFEVIERVGARTFGSANIKALYEAVEVERLREHSGAHR
ncbi:4-hydroxyphenylpyruvate dioxygenase [Streptomyces sp. NHF165]|uniref:4-hydroxyphenylpyruvate dioxygenase n=1 Tax=Streptomyces sp. NHF165 TaxID=2175864 RepID=UPI00132EF40D|nr:4-hydroxyphenylpyruvate dioxygenase [Streptomyces sp. NHF165]QHF97224.1 4-hydroxyphenylpyruvate dioxygenase [Streptomyces sp. NHF165]